MVLNIIQWNLNGFFPRRDNVQLLIKEFNPALICLQETNFKDAFCAKIGGYDSVFKNRTHTNFASGGVAIYIKKSIHQTKIHLNTNLEAVALSFIAPNEICICNVYIPNRHDFNLADLKNLIDQLPKPFILVGDFNSHNQLWGSKSTDSRGKKIEKLLLENDDIILLNDDQPTHFNISNASFSSIDLSFCSASISHRLDWEAKEDLYDSDHFPIKLELQNPLPTLFNFTSRWKFPKADWVLYGEIMNSKIEQLKIPSFGNGVDIDDLVAELVETITEAANISIPKTTQTSFKHQVPWWNSEIDEAIRKKKHAFNVYKKHNTTENMIEFKRLRAFSRRKIRSSSRKSWTDFISSLKFNTPSSEIRRKLNAIGGRTTTTRITALQKTDGSITTDSTEIADELADNYASNSSDTNYDEHFLAFKLENETISDPRFKEDKNLIINSPLLLTELISALESTKNSSPGPDRIPNILLKNLPLKALNYLLVVFNYIWIQKCFPKKWREAHIVPIAKPGKDKLRVGSYRPIALTCNMCKLMEKIINRRLRWFLEKEGFFNVHQSAFREHRSTLDALANLETNICDAFINNQHLLAVSLDIEKCYEMVWRYRILQMLVASGIDGAMLIFVRNFLMKRFIEVRVNGFLSKRVELINGVPQGSVLSVTLFLITFNDITRCIPRPIKKSIFADDLTVYCSGKDLLTTQEILQDCLDNLLKWAQKTGFKFSNSKSVCILFSKSKTGNQEPALYLNNHELEVVKETKILGLIFDTKLTWIPHLKYLRTDCNKRLNIIRTLSKRNWGADQKLLTNTYKATVRAKLDYGSIFYNSAKQTTLDMISTIHNAGLRISMGAFFSSPISSILPEAGDTPLDFRRKQLTLIYASSIASTPSNPAYANIFLGKFQDLYMDHPRAVLPLYIRVKSYLQEINLELPLIAKRRCHDFPFWDFSAPTIIIEMCKLPKNQTSSNSYKNGLNAILASFPNYTHIYTDGSKSKTGCGCSVITPNEELQFNLPEYYCVFRCETFAILQALKFIERSSDLLFVIMSDSLSAIEAVTSVNKFDHITQEIQETLFSLRERGKKITIVWVPSHMGIEGNDRADLLAKSACSLPVPEAPIPVYYKDLKNLITISVKNLWNEKWKTDEITKLHQVRKDIFEKTQILLENRKDQVVLTRLRIGHTHLTHSHLINKVDPENCDTCEVTLSIKHILMDCPKYLTRRNHHKIGTNYRRMLNDPVTFDKVLKFLDNIGIRHSI